MRIYILRLNNPAFNIGWQTRQFTTLAKAIQHIRWMERTLDTDIRHQITTFIAEDFT